MKDNRFDEKIDEIIRSSVKLTEEPAPELNCKLKAALYQQEAAMRNHPAPVPCLSGICL